MMSLGVYFFRDGKDVQVLLPQSLTKTIKAYMLEGIKKIQRLRVKTAKRRLVF